jgi:hypothetical protein
VPWRGHLSIPSAFTYFFSNFLLPRNLTLDQSSTK